MSRQTQCPNCQTTYPVPDAKLGDPKVRAKCGKCQQLFFINAHLLPVSTAQPKVASTASPQVQPATQASTPIKPQVQPQRQQSATLATAPNAQNTSLQNRAAQSTTPKNSAVNPPVSQAVSPKPSNQGAPSAPTQHAKRTKPALSEGMIHDGMDDPAKDDRTSEVVFSDDELEQFLQTNISSASYIVKSTKDELADNDSEAWVNNLLDDSQATTSQTKTHQASAPIIDEVDLKEIIPAVTPKAKKPLSIKRLTSHQPTAQQIATKKSLGSQLFWLLGCLLLVGLLGLQYMLFNMDKVAKNPTTANLARDVCAIVQCVVPSADLNSFDINATLHNQKDIIIYINNKSNTEQLFPYLLVRLKDKNGVVVADFVADTKDYLAESRTTLLANQYERIMLSTRSATTAESVTVTPFYEAP